MITDYNQAYLQKKNLGMPGWDCAEVIQDNIDQIIFLIQEGYIPSSGTFLEIGCGAGNLTAWMAIHGYLAYGIDVSEVAINWAEENAKAWHQNINFQVGNICNPGCYSDDIFDFVLDGHCLHCITGEDRGRLLSNVKSILKPGGLFIVMTMCDPVSHTNFYENSIADSSLSAKDIASHRYIGNAQDILKELQDAGFSVIKWKVTGDENQEESSSSRELIVAAGKPCPDST